MKKVRDRLYIGNITDAAAVSVAENPPVTHILSLIGSSINPEEFKRSLHIPDPDKDVQGLDPSAFPNGEKLKKKSIPLQDMESQNLLDHLEACLEFIEQGRKSGGVLVHCMAGVSRSGAVVMAHIMQTEHLSADDALASVQEASGVVSPNGGFMRQLLIFEEMGFRIDRRSPVYKKFKVSCLGSNFSNGEETESYAADPGSVIINLSTPLDGQEGQTTPSVYRCKKCRRVVAGEENVIGHTAGGGESSFKWRKRGGGRSGKDDSEVPSCTSVFVEPMHWMTSVQGGVVEGKLQCVKCNARLGNFNWAGMQCSCGAWVVPAFQLHKSRMDAAPLRVS